MSDLLRKDRLESKHNLMGCFSLACSFKNTIENLLSILENMVRANLAGWVQSEQAARAALLGLIPA